MHEWIVTDSDGKETTVVAMTSAEAVLVVDAANGRTSATKITSTYHKNHKGWRMIVMRNDGNYRYWVKVA